MGLIHDIMKGNRAAYEPGKLTFKDIENAIHSLYHKPLPPTTIFMGFISYTLIHLASDMNVHFPHIQYWTDMPKRVKTRFIYISLFQKHSLYKVKFYIDRSGYRYELFYGTISLGVANTVTGFRLLINLKKKT